MILVWELLCSLAMKGVGALQCRLNLELASDVVECSNPSRQYTYPIIALHGHGCVSAGAEAGDVLGSPCIAVAVSMAQRNCIPRAKCKQASV